jgi:hypothetical protein
MIRLAAVLLLMIPAFGVAQQSFSAKVGGTTAPDGREIQIDLPGSLHRHNVSSRGSGCCVFTSIGCHSAVWQNVPQLWEFPKWLQAKALSGGGYPGNVTARIKAICKERGVPEPAYLQIQDGDVEILKAACKAGRMPAVTYSFSPSGRYGGGRISHMVSLVHADDQFFGVLDNNYVDGPNHIEWLTPDEFRRTYTGGGKAGWSVILLQHGPPPAPRNQK